MSQALNDKITVSRLAVDIDKKYKASFGDYLKYVSIDYKNIKGILLASLIFMPKPVRLYVARKWYEKEQKPIKCTALLKRTSKKDWELVLWLLNKCLGMLSEDLKGGLGVC